MQPQKVRSVAKVEIRADKVDPPNLHIHVEGDVRTSGWSGFALSHKVYVDPPADGIFEADMVAVPPDGISSPVITPFAFDDVWAAYPAEHLKGLRVHSATNQLTAMLK